MPTDHAREVELIPIDSITVVNPRARNRKVFKEIVDNIAALGLKKPITVTRRECPEGVRYDLVCGQGRLEAYQALGQTEIPAFVIEADIESGMVMSLVENLARRQHRAQPAHRNPHLVNAFDPAGERHGLAAQEMG